MCDPTLFHDGKPGHDFHGMIVGAGRSEAAQFYAARPRAMSQSAFAASPLSTMLQSHLRRPEHERRLRDELYPSAAAANAAAAASREKFERDREAAYASWFTSLSSEDRAKAATFGHGEAKRLQVLLPGDGDGDGGEDAFGASRSQAGVIEVPSVYIGRNSSQTEAIYELGLSGVEQHLLSKTYGTSLLRPPLAFGGAAMGIKAFGKSEPAVSEDGGSSDIPYYVRGVSGPPTGVEAVVQTKKPSSAEADEDADTYDASENFFPELYFADKYEAAAAGYYGRTQEGLRRGWSFDERAADMSHCFTPLDLPTHVRSAVDALSIEIHRFCLIEAAGQGTAHDADRLFLLFETARATTDVETVRILTRNKFNSVSDVSSAEDAYLNSRAAAINLMHGVRKAFASTSFISVVLDHLATDPDLLGVPGILTVNVKPLCGNNDSDEDFGSVRGVGSEISLEAIDESLELDDLEELERLAEEQDLAQSAGSFQGPLTSDEDHEDVAVARGEDERDARSERSKSVVSIIFRTPSVEPEPRLDAADPLTADSSSERDAQTSASVESSPRRSVSTARSRSRSTSTSANVHMPRYRAKRAARTQTRSGVKRRKLTSLDLSMTDDRDMSVSPPVSPASGSSPEFTVGDMTSSSGSGSSKTAAGVSELFSRDDSPSDGATFSARHHAPSQEEPSMEEQIEEETASRSPSVVYDLALAAVPTYRELLRGHSFAHCQGFAHKCDLGRPGVPRHFLRCAATQREMKTEDLVQISIFHCGFEVFRGLVASNFSDLFLLFYRVWHIGRWCARNFAEHLRDATEASQNGRFGLEAFDVWLDDAVRLYATMKNELKRIVGQLLTDFHEDLV